MFVISAVHVDFGPSVAAVASQVVRQLFLKFGRFLVGENVFRSDGAGTLKRRTGGIVPNSLQVRIAPRRTCADSRVFAAAVLALSRRLALTTEVWGAWHTAGAQPSTATATARIPLEAREIEIHLTPPFVAYLRCLLKRPYNSSSVNGTHLNSNN